MDLVRKMTDYHQALDSFYKSSDQYQNLEEVVSGWLNDPETQIFVAEDVGSIIGYIRIGIEIAPEYSAEKKIGIVYDSLVREEYRRQGIAGQLFNEALGWFQKKRVNFLELNIDFRNEEAVGFWKKMGFREVKLRMRRRIGE